MTPSPFVSSAPNSLEARVSDAPLIAPAASMNSDRERTPSALVSIWLKSATAASGSILPTDTPPAAPNSARVITPSRLKSSLLNSSAMRAGDAAPLGAPAALKSVGLAYSELFGDPAPAREEDITRREDHVTNSSHVIVSTESPTSLSGLRVTPCRPSAPFSSELFCRASSSVVLSARAPSPTCSKAMTSIFQTLSREVPPLATPPTEALYLPAPLGAADADEGEA
mmetsp:Transcript_91163/g.237529  ORF Transcript_91163/g.237529 Transcript_91163/m.237529 type:complete len:226 (-) Transcript_91163:191-868(-)